MNLYLLSQDINVRHDTYSCAIVCAETEEQARMIHPDGTHEDWDGKVGKWSCWCDAEYVEVKLIGCSAPGIDANKILYAEYGSE